MGAAITCCTQTTILKGHSGGLCPSGLTPSCSGSLWPFFMIRVKWLHKATILNDSCGASERQRVTDWVENNRKHRSIDIQLTFHLRLAYCRLKFSRFTTDNLFTIACLGFRGCKDTHMLASIHLMSSVQRIPHFHDDRGKISVKYMTTSFIPVLGLSWQSDTRSEHVVTS